MGGLFYSPSTTQGQAERCTGSRGPSYRAQHGRLRTCRCPELKPTSRCHPGPSIAGHFRFLLQQLSKEHAEPMITSFPLYLCLGVLLGAGLANSETGEVTERVGNTVQRFVKIPTESFTQPSIAELCKKFMKEEKVPLSKLILATTETDLLSMRVQKATHTSYQSWYPEFVGQRASVGPAAELITVAGRATLRIQDRREAYRLSSLEAILCASSQMGRYSTCSIFPAEIWRRWRKLHQKAKYSSCTFSLEARLQRNPSKHSRRTSWASWG